MRSSMSWALIPPMGEESSDMTVAFDLYGGDGVFTFLALGFGVHGLDLKGLDSSIESKYSIFRFPAELWDWVVVELSGSNQGEERAGHLYTEGAEQAAHGM